MTHYMELLAENQPWNLIVFMAIPVILAETLVATEFFIVYSRQTDGFLRTLNRYVGCGLALWFTGIVVYLGLTVIPSITWRGWIDIVAVMSYLAGVIPLLGIILLELGFLARTKTPDEKLKIHVILIIAFLVLAHIAMVFGMLDPSLATPSSMDTPGTAMDMGHH